MDSSAEDFSRPGDLPMLDLLDGWLALAVALAILFGIFQATRPRWSVLVIADRHGLRTCRGIAKAHQSMLVDFFTKEMPLTGRVKIRGLRQKNGLLRLHVDGPIDSGSRQRIRNFLLSLL